MLCHAGQHFGADFIVIVEGENKIRLATPGESFMGAGLSFHLPADP
jgi:hypothetical protein